jgi:hypothetical protein
MGSDYVKGVEEALKVGKKEIEEWKELSLSTDS